MEKSQLPGCSLQCHTSWRDAGSLLTVCFNRAGESSVAQVVYIMTRLCSLSDDKDPRCSSHEEDSTDWTYMPHTCTQLSPVVFNEVYMLRSAPQSTPLVIADACRIWWGALVATIGRPKSWHSVFTLGIRAQASVILRHISMMLGPMACLLLDSISINHSHSHPLAYINHYL